MKIRKLCSQLALCLPIVIAATLATPARQASAQACTPNPARVISWWPGDNNATDIIGGHHGTLAGSATFGAGKVKQAFHFDGSGWVDVPDSPAWTLGNHDFTIELWANFNSLTGLDPLIAHTDGGGPQKKWIFWFNTSGHDKLQNTPALRFMMNEVPLPGHDIVVAPWNPATGRWYHLAVTRSSDTYRLYIDGTLAATDTSPGPIPDPIASLTIGRAEAFILDGKIDEPAIYSRALTAHEISDIADAGSAGKCKPTISVPEFGWVGGAIALVAGIGIITFGRKRIM